jgi:hypothetical protein
MSARRAFLRHLIDDAGLFPPAALPMRDALRTDGVARAGPESWMVGRFIVPVSRLGELVAQLEPHAAPLGLSIIGDATRIAEDLERALAYEQSAAGTVRIESLEFKLPEVEDGDVRSAILCAVAEVDASGIAPGTSTYLEFAFGADWRSHVATTIDAVADARARSAHDVGAKIRCGGVTADAVPSPEQLAFAIGTLRALSVPFKATAGLHHPVRHHNEQAGFTMHGFLNVVGAAVLDFALDFDERTRVRAIAERSALSFSLDDTALRWSGFAADEGQISAARREFVRSYGSCSLSEPVDDLVALGILERAPAA